MSILITVCVLLILAYLFDISSPKTRVPSIILLLLLGWLVKKLAGLFSFEINNIELVLPILGTIGLVLIVLEGSLELEIKKEKYWLIGKAILLALLPIFIFSVGVGYFLNYQYNVPWRLALINILPLAIISSAIAIPSAQNLIQHKREFVTYESSLSDIFGVIAFNFLILNAVYDVSLLSNFLLQLLIIVIISILTSFFLSYLLSKINHHVKYLPIIIVVILIYSISKIFHLPALIFIMCFGLFLGNIDEIKNNKIIHYLKPETLTNEVIKFKELLGEFTFLIRALFFLLFGFLIELKDLTNIETLKWAGVLSALIYFLRYLLFKIFKIPVDVLVFIAPRGLITILLFLSIPLSDQIPYINKSLILQVIILTAIIMMIGFIFNKDEKESKPEEISKTSESQ